MSKLRKKIRIPSDRYSTRRAAEYLGVKRERLHQLVHRGELGREKVSHRVIVFDRRELDRYLAERGEVPANPDA